jgi:hypothetical protein
MKITTAAISIMLSTTVGSALLRSTLGFVVRPNAVTRITTGTSTATATTTTTERSLFNRLFSNPAATSQYPVTASEDVMSQKKHGTSEKPVQKNLRWNCDFETAE